MGANFSLIVVRILRKQKRNCRRPNEKMVLNNEKLCCSNDEKVEDTLLSSTRKDTGDLEALSDDESGVCYTIVVGTSNNNFLKYRHQKIVSTCEI